MIGAADRSALFRSAAFLKQVWCFPRGVVRSVDDRFDGFAVRLLAKFGFVDDRGR